MISSFFPNTPQQSLNIMTHCFVLFFPQRDVISHLSIYTRFFFFHFMFRVMACLVHNSRYRSLFHAVVNELRHENRTPLSILRNMPRKCCTCTDIDKLTLISVLTHDKEILRNLEKLIDQINQDKKNNPKLVLALNRLENFIKENRGPVPTISTTDVEMRDCMSESGDDISMDIKRLIVRKQEKPPKTLKNGTFLFLPYKFADEPNSSVLLAVAKKLQRGRFLGRNKYIKTTEKQHNVFINMITSKTTEQIKLTLKNARAGIGNVTIHNKEDLSEDGGEWILVRQKKNADQTNTTDFEALLSELKDRWDSFLKVQKRKSKFDDDDDECPNKK